MDQPGNRGFVFVFALRCVRCVPCVRASGSGGGARYTSVSRVVIPVPGPRVGMGFPIGNSTPGRAGVDPARVG